ncbi:hypothetical protein WG922_02645 [Ramlibacter sp. AN1015]|uniref:hypothetical protein n=1 Tax=Ramlibacter sp. AN1015 TaxID=3133428 RepID=UPI0030BD7237
MNSTPLRPADNAAASTLPAQLELSQGRGDWVQAVMVTLLAWLALLCAGLSGTPGVASHQLAGKIAGNGQHFQRQAGTSHAARAARRDSPALAATQQFAHAWHAAGIDDVDGPLPGGHFTFSNDECHADEAPPSKPAPRLKPRYRAHPSRAPPLLA